VTHSGCHSWTCGRGGGGEEREREILYV
jgi:hypothetical protein